MSSIFISYRRSDSIDVAGRIYDRLVAEFGTDVVFKDVDSIPAGANYRTYLKQILRQCHVLLVLIGPTWANSLDDQGKRRLDNPQDWVRIEIEEALQRTNVRVIPLLLGTATKMPTCHELPPGLEALVNRQALPCRPDPDFHKDMSRLIGELGKDVWSSQNASPSTPGLQYKTRQNSTIGREKVGTTRRGFLRLSVAGAISAAVALGIHKASQNRLIPRLRIGDFIGEDNRDPLSQSTDSPSQNSLPLTDERSIQLDEKYIHLDALLRAGIWQAADQETTRLLLEVANRQAEGWLDNESLYLLSCSTIQIIDHLWIMASNGKFGFSTQKRIYLEECSGQLDGQYDEISWPCFANKVGWLRDGNSLDYSELNFDIGAPMGHLPSLFNQGMERSVFSRITFGFGGGLLDILPACYEL
jgi:hypothetical protein